MNNCRDRDRVKAGKEKQSMLSASEPSRAATIMLYTWGWNACMGGIVFLFPTFRKKEELERGMRIITAGICFHAFL